MKIPRLIKEVGWVLGDFKYDDTEFFEFTCFSSPR